MPTPSEQPRFDQPVVDNSGRVTRAWADYFLRMASAQTSSDLRALYEALAARVAQLEDGQTLSFQIVGPQSVVVNGVPQPGGIVSVQLDGDQDAPGNTAYYGTGPDGVRGWFPLESATQVVAGELSKAVGSDGVTTLGLAPEVVASLALANSAVQEVVAGPGVSVDDTDPQRPVISAVEKAGVFIGGVELTSSFVNTSAAGEIVAITGMTFTFSMPDRPVLVSFGSTAFYDSADAANLGAVILRVNGADVAQLFFSAAITNFWSQGKQYMLSGVPAGTSITLEWWLNMGPGTFTVFGNPADKPYIYAVTA